MKLWPLKFLSVGSLLVTCGCAAMGTNLAVCKDLPPHFLELTPNDQLKAFAALPLQKQYDAYICGNRALHPPAAYLAEPLARRGGVAMPLLKSKLSEAIDDLDVRDIVYVFSLMQKTNAFDVANDALVMDIIRTRTGGIKDSFWHGYTLSLVNEIVKK